MKKTAEVSGALCASIEHAWDCINTNCCVRWEAVQKSHLESLESSSYISGLLNGMKVEFQINKKYGVLEKNELGSKLYIYIEINF